MKKTTITIVLVLIFVSFFPRKTYAKDSYWDVQSIDTMKYSRDMARLKKGDRSFIVTIDSQVKKIADSGATHVAVATPYDDEFIPYMKTWVASARRYNLKVWFRGNFSGWEGWFDYPEIGRAEHIINLISFLSKNGELFEDGDIFTPCTECENGGPGDPRSTGDIEGFRNFLITERETSIKSFKDMGKDVKAGYFSMNGDVAKLIMDKPTTKKLGNIVVVDHYVRDPEVLDSDIRQLAEKSGGEIILGEMGAPIPDIHGDMNESQQNGWLAESLSLLSQNPKVIGINYWVAEGGTTALWDGLRSKEGVHTLSRYFQPELVTGNVTNKLDKALPDVTISYDGRTFKTDWEGRFKIETVPSIREIKLAKEGYKEKSVNLEINGTLPDIILEKEKESLIFKIQVFFHKLFNK